MDFLPDKTQAVKNTEQESLGQVYYRHVSGTYQGPQNYLNALYKMTPDVTVCHF